MRNDQVIATVWNESDRPVEFHVELALDDSLRTNRFVAHTEHGFSPWRRGMNNDSRELGFSLFSAEFGGAADAAELRVAHGRPPSVLVEAAGAE